MTGELPDNYKGFLHALTWCDKHQSHGKKHREQSGKVVKITYICPLCEAEKRRIPAVIEWIRGVDLITFSQFTIDWVEIILEGYDEMDTSDVMPLQVECLESLEYDVQNILAIMRSDLPDVEFFKEVLRRCRMT